MFENIDTSKTHVRNVHEYLLAKKSNLANDYKKINDIMELAKLPVSIGLFLPLTPPLFFIKGKMFH